MARKRSQYLRKVILSLCALVSVSAANAATVVGKVKPEFGSISVNGPAAGGPGVYLFHFELSRPGTGYFTILAQQTFNLFDASDGSWFGGDDVPYEPIWFFNTPTTSASVLFKLPRPYVNEYSGIIEKGFFTGTGSMLAFDFVGDRKVEYSISAQFLAAIPAPASWVMMIAGMFGVAGVLRAPRARKYRMPRTI